MPQNFFEFLVSRKEWKASFKSSMDMTLHLELPSIEKVSFKSGYARLFFAIHILRCLKSVTTLLSLVIFLLINITGLEWAEKPSFNIPK